MGYRYYRRNEIFKADIFIMLFNFIFYAFLLVFSLNRLDHPNLLIASICQALVWQSCAMLMDLFCVIGTGLNPSGPHFLSCIIPSQAADYGLLPLPWISLGAWMYFFIGVLRLVKPLLPNNIASVFTAGMLAITLWWAAIIFLSGFLLFLIAAEIQRYFIK